MKRLRKYITLITQDILYDKVAFWTLIILVAIFNIFHMISGSCVSAFNDSIDNVSSKLGADIVIVSNEYDEDMQEALFMGYPSTIIFDSYFLCP